MAFPVFSDVGVVNDLPIVCVKMGFGPKKVLLTGVVHGDEPAGMFTIGKFIREHAAEYCGDFSFVAFPCLNPWGYQNQNRGNSQGINLNRDFTADPDSEEVKILLPLLEQYEFTFDFHETWASASRLGDNEPQGDDPTEFYLWEISEGVRYGDKIVAAVEEIGLPVCKWEKIYGDTNSGGVIYYPEGCGTPCYASGTSLDAYLHANHTKSAYTIETPVQWDMEDRVKAGVTALKTRLDLARQ